ncbi:universal stress protein [Streptomyces sp. MS06]|uniref:universal stress protein n=1 Tax=Streptomyces sp. MS06 TaxID=3385974 RepID=UPI0039A0C180
MDLPVVVGTDGSEASLRAVDWAADEAALRGLPLRVVYASLWERYEGDALARDIGGPDREVTAGDLVAAAVRRAEHRQPDLKVTGDVLPEEPEYALVAEGRRAAALVLGTRGRGGIAEALLGSVSLAAAGHADCPVVVVRGSHDNQARRALRGRVVVGVGEGPGATDVVRFAAEEARRRGVPLDAVSAWKRPAHEASGHPLLTGDPARPHEERAVAALEAALAGVAEEVTVRRHTVEGHALRVLADASWEADLLVVGARRRPAHHGSRLGRVAHGVLHRSGCPVAVVPHS